MPEWCWSVVDEWVRNNNNNNNNVLFIFSRIVASGCDCCKSETQAGLHGGCDRKRCKKAGESVRLQRSLRTLRLGLERMRRRLDLVRCVDSECGASNALTLSARNQRASVRHSPGGLLLQRRGDRRGKARVAQQRRDQGGLCHLWKSHGCVPAVL